MRQAGVDAVGLAAEHAGQLVGGQLARPPAPMTELGLAMEVTRSVGRSRSPLPARTETRIWLSRKSVGLTVSRTPLGKVTRVTPRSAISVRALAASACRSRRRAIRRRRRRRGP